MECTKVNCPIQAGTPTDSCGENCPWRTTAKSKAADLISRGAACDEIGKMIHEYREKDEHDLADALILSQRYVLKRLPAVDAIPVEWLEAQISPYRDKLRDEAKGVFNATVREILYRWQKEQEAR